MAVRAYSAVAAACTPLVVVRDGATGVNGVAVDRVDACEVELDPLEPGRQCWVRRLVGVEDIDI
jgi:hypothetical protein